MSQIGVANQSIQQLDDADALAGTEFMIALQGAIGVETEVKLPINDLKDFIIESIAGIAGAIQTEQVAFGTATDVIGGSNNLTWNGSSLEVTGSIKENNNFVHTKTTVIVRTEADLPSAISDPLDNNIMKHPLAKNTIYMYDSPTGLFIQAIPLLFPDESVNSFVVTGIDGVVGITLLYTGTTTFITGHNISAFTLDNIFFAALNPGVEFINLTQSQTPGVIGGSFAARIAIVGFSKLGMLTGFGSMFWRAFIIIDWEEPLQIHDPESINIGSFTFDNRVQGTSNNVALALSGTGTTWVVDTSDLFLQGGESLIAIDSGVAISKRININNMGFSDEGGTVDFFQPDIVDSITAFADSPLNPGIDTRCTLSAATIATAFRNTTITSSSNHNGTHKITFVDLANLFFDIAFPFGGGPDTGTSTVSSLTQDVRMTLTGNGSQKNSRNVGSAVVQNNATVTTFGAPGVFVDIVLSGGGLAVAGEDIERWRLNDNTKASLIYDGIDNFNGEASVVIYAMKTGSDRSYKFRIVIDGTDGVEVPMDIKTETRLILAIRPIADLTTNQIVKLQVSPIGHTDSLTLTDLIFVVR